MELTLEINKVADHFFGLSSLHPIQYQIIHDLLNKEDVLAVLPTGSGKSLCYQIPGLICRGTLIVISPLISLINEQVHKLQESGIAAYGLHSHLDPKRIAETLDKLKQQEIKILYLAPERLLQPSIINILKKIEISTIAIDEVHCMLHWGGDFRPEYERLNCLKTIFPNTPILALTATATPTQQQAIITQLKISPKKHIHSTFKPNIEFKIIPQYLEKIPLTRILNQHIGQSGIIYCGSQKRVEFLYQHLKTFYNNVLYYHAGLDSLLRSSQQQRFYDVPGSIMIATLAFGMGIDKKDIRFILHYDIPGRMDQFIQESGRAGRDQQLATHYLLYHPKHFFQLNLWRILKAPEILRAELVEELRIMSQFVNREQCFQQQIVSYFEDIHIHECQQCEACLAKNTTTIDRVDALKLMSCIYRLAQAAEFHLIIALLLGHNNHPRIKEYLHLSTYGIGKNHTQGYWYDLFIRLFAKNLITLKKNCPLFWQVTPEGQQMLKQYKSNLKN